MTSWALMTVPRAFSLGLCRHRRRSLALRKAWARPTLAAAAPRASQAPVQGLPRLAAFLPFRFPPGSFTRGTQAAGVLRRRVRPGQRPPPGHPRQPHRVQLARLRPPRQRLDLRGLVKHAVRALPLQQEEHGFPVIGRAFLGGRTPHPAPHRDAANPHKPASPGHGAPATPANRQPHRPGIFTPHSARKAPETSWTSSHHLLPGSTGPKETSSMPSSWIRLRSPCRCA